MARPTRKAGVREIPLSEVKDDLSHLLREAANGDIVITRHGKPAGVLIGFKSEDDWFEYRLGKRSAVFAADRKSAPEPARRPRRALGGRMTSAGSPGEGGKIHPERASAPSIMSMVFWMP